MTITNDESRSAAAARRLAWEIDDLRPLPAVAARLLALTDSTCWSAHEIAGVIASDQVMTARLLRLANSAYYGFRRRISTVRDAVVLVGFRAVRPAAVVSCVIDTVTRASLLDVAACWRFSVSVGVIAEALARPEGVDEEQAFAAGVLHNVGLIALDQHQPDALREVIEEVRALGRPLPAAERLIIGFTDGELAAALAQRWQFPPPLVEAIRDHAHALEALPDPRTVAAVVTRARLLARAHGLSDGADRGGARDAQEAGAAWLPEPAQAALRRTGALSRVLERAQATSV